jgi:thousand and one amino acid protein kinase
MQSIGGIAASSQSSSSNSILTPVVDQQGNAQRNSTRQRPPAIPPHHQQQPQYVNAIAHHIGYANHHHHHHPHPQVHSMQAGSSRELHNHHMQQPMYGSAGHHSNHAQQAAVNAIAEHGANNFATIRTTSIVTKQQKEHMQEDMHEQMSGYKRMRREHQAALLKLEERCKVEMETHKTTLDKEYDLLLHNFTRELEKLSVKHQQELERRSKQNNVAEKKLFKEISMRQEGDRKAFDTHRKKEYKANKERWKRELSMDDATPKRQRDATLQ